MNRRPSSEYFKRQVASRLSGTPLMRPADKGQSQTFLYQEALVRSDHPLPPTRESLLRCGCSIGLDLESHAFAVFQDVPANSPCQQLGTWDRSGRPDW